MSSQAKDSLATRQTLTVDGKTYTYFSLKKLEEQTDAGVTRIPRSIKVLLENLLRQEDGERVTTEDIESVLEWCVKGKVDREIAFRPSRVLMQDFTGVPAVVDLAAMREAMTKLGGDPKKINPLSQVDLVIDHSVMVDSFGAAESFEKNVDLEFVRNQERYAFLKWGQKAFNNFRVVPPGTGICHQVNLENLAQVAWIDTDTHEVFPDSVVGTDSHTTMINGLGVLGWGVGGIEAEAAMLGQPISMLVPEVVGFELKGEMREGTTATDLVLTVTQMLRKKGVVGKFVEFYGAGLDHLSLADRATIANMAPEYGATCGFFPVDEETIAYLRFTGRDAHRVALAEAYAKAQGMWRDATTPDPVFTETLSLDISTVEPSLAGPKRPQDRVALSAIASEFKKSLTSDEGQQRAVRSGMVEGKTYDLKDGAVVLAAITSCTNTSNPSVMIGAGLLARNANRKGLKVKPWVKTSLAPGSQVVTDYLEKAELQSELDRLGFNLVGYGCTTCIGNSGPLPEDISKSIEHNHLTVCSVLSGNRNFEGRINPLTKANYLASPLLVVAYALAGTVTLDLLTEPLGEDLTGQPVYLKDIWPSNAEIHDAMRAAVTPEMFKKRYSNVFEGETHWSKIGGSGGFTYQWDKSSTYVQNPPYFEGMKDVADRPGDILNARLLALLGDSVTTDHISPAGSIKANSPAGLYLQEHRVAPQDFNSYGSRRGNHEVMMRGTFANIRLQNEMVPGTTGGVTKYIPDGGVVSIFDAAMKYKQAGTPLVIVAGLEYGTGSSRDWAAKGTRLLGVKAVIAESFERIHRSNLIGMGILPLEFKKGDTRKTLALTGAEVISIRGVESLRPGATVSCLIAYEDGKTREIELRVRIDTADELAYYRNDGILHYVLRSMAGLKPEQLAS